jgi:DNA repair protein RecO (recombination protein O)
MPQSIKTNGIVLKGTNFGEADRILTILTERQGKIKAIAKGVRKIRSHMAGALEPFMLVDLQFHEGRSMHIVTGAVIVDDYSGIHNDLDKISQAFYIGELIDKLVPEDIHAPEVFEIAKEIFSLISAELKTVVMRAFELKIVEAGGFKPELFNCIHCREAITPNDNYWDGVEGGLICSNCQKIERHGKEIKDETVKLLRFFERNSLFEVNRLRLDEGVQDEVEKILINYLDNVLERELKSRSFISQIKNRQI